MTDESDESGFPLIGDQFPELEVETTHGPKSIPDDYEGKWFILFSHPGDFTPVCTTEFVGFEQRREAFEELNTELIGLSIDRVHSHIKWTEWIDEEIDEKIDFPIIADESGDVADALGMVHPGQGSSTVRAVFIVDPDGITRQVLYYPKEIGRNVDEVLRSLEALQTSDQEGVALPANWPENENFGDKVLLSPPGTVDEAEARTAEADEEGYESYDWWFTLKELES
ncbi:peroxiredoxin [Natrialba magadii ATCC 43099]|uniref:Peroxiredoxin n=1 Tax=Natrialba magadii (strain ATCC 43099 / DSM 3394 / CCM 3739 / CIP 104546 / IAM 13178 / JCM 8861 / NBRC 102185 / NCIMB 2190 / MS3) TaxID=547559 RepID=D3SRC8_NATMM|nr:peroxiredoxin [Natrialba magadii]ADD04633.1 peroxiredoxin [Natrialba magadii ATCC 43099]ELY25288.1 peroxiredoxin [Natrialba magadii ATCC 43099]